MERQPQQAVRFRIVTLRATTLAVVIASGAFFAWILGRELPLPEPRPAPATSTPQEEPPAPAPAEAPPPPDRPSLEAPPGLTPLAARWRQAIILGQREHVLRGMMALRAAPDGREQLVRLAGDANARIRAYALRELGRRQDPGLSELFQARLDDTSPYVRENAAWALGLLEAMK